MKLARLWLLAILIPITALFAFREYRIRQVFELAGQISSCKYTDANRYCSLFTTTDASRFLLTEGSVLELKKIDPEIANFYDRPIKVSVHILGQKIGVENFGKINRIEVIGFTN